MYTRWEGVNRMNAQDIRNLRQRLNLSQQELASRLGVAVATVHRWETGKNPIPPYLALALAELEARNETMH